MRKLWRLEILMESRPCVGRRTISIVFDSTITCSNTKKICNKHNMSKLTIIIAYREWYLFAKCVSTGFLGPSQSVLLTQDCSCVNICTFAQYMYVRTLLESINSFYNSVQFWFQINVYIIALCCSMQLTAFLTRAIKLFPHLATLVLVAATPGQTWSRACCSTLFTKSAQVNAGIRKYIQVQI